MLSAKMAARCMRVALVASVAACAIALLASVVWFVFATHVGMLRCVGCGGRNLRLVDAAHGLLDPRNVVVFATLIIASLLVLTGMMAVGTYLHITDGGSRAERRARGRAGTLFSARMAARWARVELACSVAVFASAVAVSVVWFFFPVHLLLPGCQRCAGGYVRLVDGSVGSYYLDHVDVFGTLSVVLVLLSTGVVALGAYLHLRRRVAAGRVLIWSGCLPLLALLLVILVLVHVADVQDFLVNMRYNLFASPFSASERILVVVWFVCPVVALLTPVAALGGEQARRQAIDRAT